MRYMVSALMFLYSVSCGNSMRLQSLLYVSLQNFCGSLWAQPATVDTYIIIPGISPFEIGVVIVVSFAADIMFVDFGNGLFSGD